MSLLSGKIYPDTTLCTTGITELWVDFYPSYLQDHDIISLQGVRKIAANNLEAKLQADKLYEQYGKPLEDTHLGEYIAIAPDGKYLISQDLLDVVNKATDTFGPGILSLSWERKPFGSGDGSAPYQLSLPLPTNTPASSPTYH